MLSKLDFHLSASTINAFSTCPWSFKQDKILKRRPLIELSSVPLVKGQAFHKLVENFYKHKSWNTYDLFQNWGRFFDIEVKLQKMKNDPGLKFAKNSGFTMIKNWVAMAKKYHWLHEAYIFDDKKEGVELEFLLPYENDRFAIDVHGYIDLVIEINDKIYILDWKTGKHDDEKYKLQALIYSWAMYKKYGIVEECVRFVHPAKKHNTIIDVKVKDEDYTLVSDKVEQIFDAIENDSFKKHVCDNCKWCKWVDCSNNTNEDLKQLVAKIEAENADD